MTTTTKDMKPGDALIAVGTWLNNGYEVEEREVGELNWHYPDINVITIKVIGEQNFEYRPKPRKPLIGTLTQMTACGLSYTGEEAIELTPEVRAVLEPEGLL